MGFFNFFTKRTNTIDIWQDTNTGLMWQLDIEPKLMSWYEANEYVKSINSMNYGGYSDWRLPTIYEQEKVHRYRNLDIAWKYKEKGISVSDFSKAFYWSSTLLENSIEKMLDRDSVSQEDIHNKVWNICISNAMAGYDDKTDKQCVRLVRSNYITKIEQADKISNEEFTNLFKQDNGILIIEEGADNGNLDCQQLLYTIYLAEINLDEKNKDKYEHYTKLAAYQNDPIAQSNYAKIIYDSIEELKSEYLEKHGGVPTDSLLYIQDKLQKSLGWYKKAYDNGNTDAVESINNVEFILKDFINPLVHQHYK